MVFEPMRRRRALLRTWLILLAQVSACASGDVAHDHHAPPTESMPPPMVSAVGETVISAATSTATAHARKEPHPSFPLQVVSHPRPTGHVSVGPFVQAGCRGPKDGRTTVADGEEAEIDCANSTGIAALQCDRIVLVGALQELEAKAPLARCEVVWIHTSGGRERWFLGDLGCGERRDSFGYVVQRGSKWEYAGDPRKLNEIYGPIRTAAEALAWVRMAGQTTLFELHAPEGALLTEESSQAEDVSFAEPVPEGFRVRAFTGNKCAAGKTIFLQAIDLTVTPEREIGIRDAHIIYSSQE